MVVLARSSRRVVGVARPPRGWLRPACARCLAVADATAALLLSWWVASRSSWWLLGQRRAEEDEQEAGGRRASEEQAAGGGEEGAAGGARAAWGWPALLLVLQELVGSTTAAP